MAGYRAESELLDEVVTPAVTVPASATQYADGATAATPTGTVALGKNPSNVLHALALDASANLQTIAVQSGTWNIGTVATVTAVTTVATVTNLAQIGGVAVAMGSGVRTAGTQRITIATDDVLGTVSNLSAMGGATINMGTGTRGVGTQRVTIATDDIVQASQSGTWNVGTVTTVTGVTTVSTVTNLAQLGGVAVSMGTGVRAAGTQRVTIATDDVVPASQSGAWNISSVGTVTTVGTITTVSNLSSMAGAPITMGTGVRTAGTQRVTIATDDVVPAAQSGTWTVQPGNTANTTRWLVDAAGNAANGAADAGNPVKIGGVARTANPTAVTNGQRVDAAYDKLGRQIVALGQARDLIGVQHTQIASSSAETTVVTAGAAGVFNDITALVITNQTATAVNCTLKDATGGTTRAILALAASGGIVINYARPLPQAAAAANWTITLSSAAVTVNVQAVFEKNL